MKLQFTFDEALEENLRVINQALGGLRISELELENLDGCAATTREYKDERVTSTRHWYGVEALTLALETAEDGDLYRLTAEVLTRPAPDGAAYMEAWRREHPGWLPRVMQQIQFGSELVAFVVVGFYKP